MRFRIRTLLSIVAVVAISVVIAESTTRSYRGRCRIEADLHSMGAYYVSFDENNSPTWVGFVDPVRFDHIEEYESFDHLDFAGASITNDTVRGLSNLKSVRVLHLTDCNVTDDQLKMLASIGSIWMLRLNGSSVTDDAIPAIASLHGLKSLDVSGTLITFAGVAELQQRCPDIVVRHEPR
ncbi:Leucine Rich repeats (2 copies) [Rubripirellula lacrimiformis]|uniref:Leucine Rich repeats (2 copies) n=1 Tax=Rubripirellula lacrimiformis TaxID=1930273 RepID=A0A517N9Y4_9BACT|nr:hypothetical protein [Rubripirellula lacrimiformis]QDT03946.1 Leucine Rich repeats (2 copies) [Rubripirellula lacrimiformis]